MTPRQFLAEGQPASGICRFCGCTDIHACNPPCSWVDKRHTVCSALECQAKYHALVKPALEALVSARCACPAGRIKSRKMPFCTTCWSHLPWSLQSPLYEQVNRGFAAYYVDAIEFLKKLRRSK